MPKVKKVMVDMSATILHHGHIRILKKASRYGDVIVALTSDEEIYNSKGYRPEMNFLQRKEILSSIRFVKKVVKSPWLIDDKFLKRHKIDLLIHGHDNMNIVDKNRIKIVKRTANISSSGIREISSRILFSKNSQKLMLTPGPGQLPYESVKGIKPVFGRGDQEYEVISSNINQWLKKLSGQDNIVAMQGSATFSLELACHSFVKGNVLIITNGYYGDRLKFLLPRGTNKTIISPDEIQNINGKFDWIICAYTETSVAIKNDLHAFRSLANKLGSKILLDATASIGLEPNHHLADVCCFSSCKGLFGLTGASFIAYKSHLSPKNNQKFYFNLNTHLEKKVTGPYHILTSLNEVSKVHKDLVKKVKESKKWALGTFSPFNKAISQEPLLCTHIKEKIDTNNRNIILYQPRLEVSGSIICHLGNVRESDWLAMQQIKEND